MIDSVAHDDNVIDEGEFIEALFGKKKREELLMKKNKKDEGGKGGGLMQRRKGGCKRDGGSEGYNRGGSKTRVDALMYGWVDAWTDRWRRYGIRNEGGKEGE